MQAVPRGAFLALVGCVAGANAAAPSDPRVREVTYDGNAVIAVPLRRGVVTDIALDPTEAIVDVAAGLGGDCAKPESPWCIAAQAGGNHVFVKPKSGAKASNNLIVISDRGSYLFRLDVLDDADPREVVYRLTLKPRALTEPSPPVALPPPGAAASAAVAMPAAEVVAARLRAAPQVLNSAYSVAESANAQDIVPTLIFDDGRFTYLRFAANANLPAVFEVREDGSEGVVNTRMEDDLLAIDRVSRRLVLRSGTAAVGVFNEGFHLEGEESPRGTTVRGVERATRGGLPGRSDGGLDR